MTLSATDEERELIALIEDTEREVLELLERRLVNRAINGRLLDSQRAALHVTISLSGRLAITLIDAEGESGRAKNAAMIDGLQTLNATHGARAQ